MLERTTGDTVRHLSGGLCGISRQQRREEVEQVESLLPKASCPYSPSRHVKRAGSNSRRALIELLLLPDSTMPDPSGFLPSELLANVLDGLLHHEVVCAAGSGYYDRERPSAALNARTELVASIDDAVAFGTPVDLRFSLVHEQTQFVQTVIAGVVQKAMPLLRRLEIRATPDKMRGAMLRALSSSPAPLLRTFWLSFDGTGPAPQHRPADLIMGQAPRLSYFTMRSGGSCYAGAPFGSAFTSLLKIDLCGISLSGMLFQWSMPSLAGVGRGDQLQSCTPERPLVSQLAAQQYELQLEPFLEVFSSKNCVVRWDLFPRLEHFTVKCSDAFNWAGTLTAGELDYLIHPMDLDVMPAARRPLLTIEEIDWDSQGVEAGRSPIEGYFSSIKVVIKVCRSLPSAGELVQNFR
ncbi:hypothetical protein BKA62DRAFT_673904 [Auriculariales sp. MPI-PUGE-AT-0066]|nr:hypothetical protein BKA62DRAFT_673904 [Auriculariales sp. MPI-PUGE-AT-0066]